MKLRKEGEILQKKNLFLMKAGNHLVQVHLNSSEQNIRWQEQQTLIKKIDPHLDSKRPLRLKGLQVSRDLRHNKICLINRYVCKEITR